MNEEEYSKPLTFKNNYRLMTKRLTLVEARKKAWSIGGVVARFFQNLFII